jgi:hypothetical protein
MQSARLAARPGSIILHTVGLYHLRHMACLFCAMAILFVLFQSYLPPVVFGAEPSPSAIVTFNVSARVLRPGNEFRLGLGISNTADIQADLYVAVLTPKNELLFLAPDLNHWSSVPIAFQAVRRSQQDLAIPVISLVLPPEIAAGEYVFAAVLTQQGSSPFQPETWLSNVAVQKVVLTYLPLTPYELVNEPYLFPVRLPDQDAMGYLPLNRWDIMFMGEVLDDPSTPQNEALISEIIPGLFNHIAVYLGRDKDGQAYGMEITPDFTHKSYELRLIRLPEYYELAVPVAENTGEPVQNKDLAQYTARWAKRFAAEPLTELTAAEERLFARMQADMEANLPYQMEYYWSGNFFDRAIYIVDDGLKNGANCTDYWLSVFEEIAGICFKGVRMNVQEANAYFQTDPVGANVYIPDFLNPFPTPLKISDLFHLGFYLVEPPPHVFLCDGSQETGLPIPDKVFASSLLVNIPVPFCVLAP